MARDGDEDAALASLVEYLTKLGGRAEFLSGWRVRVAVREPSDRSTKVNDVYFYDAHGAKYRSKVEVARHFGLIDGEASRPVGHLSADGIDAKLWAGASAAGWAVHSTPDCHNTYSAPDGSRFKRKSDALEWKPAKRIVLKLKERSSETSVIAAAEAPATTCQSAVAGSSHYHATAGVQAARDQEWFDLNSSDDDDDEEEEQSAANAAEMGARSEAEQLVDEGEEHTHEDASHQLQLTDSFSTQLASGMSLAQMLTHCRSSAYLDAFEESGWDDVGYLVTLPPAELEDIVGSLGMKLGHRAKFLHLFEALRSRISTLLPAATGLPAQ